MKLISAVGVVALILLINVSCGISSKRSDATDSLKTETGVPPVEENSNAPASIEITLKWKSASYDEYGISYGFEDQEGKDVYFYHLDIPGFTDDSNDFYTSTRTDDRMFPTLTIKEEIKDKWFKVRTGKQMRTSQGSGEESEVDVIVSIEPLQ